MKAKRAILDITCATAVAGMAIWLVVGHQDRLRQREDNRALREQLSQLAGLVAENERLSNLVAQAKRSQALPDGPLRELLRLRGEVGILRQQSNEIQTLRAASNRARTALENGLNTQNAAPTGSVATADYWPRDSWAFAGYASPDTALQSALWAGNKGDAKRFFGSITSDIVNMGDVSLDGEAGRQWSNSMMASFAGINSVRVLSREVQADDTVVLTIASEPESGTETERLTMKKGGNEWKLFFHR